MTGEVIVKGLTAPEIGRLTAHLANNNPPERGSTRFLIIRINSVVANQRVGHHHHLPIVGGIGKNLLVAGQGRIEDNLSNRLPIRTNRDPAQNGSIL